MGVTETYYKLAREAKEEGNLEGWLKQELKEDGWVREESLGQKGLCSSKTRKKYRQI